MKLESMGPKPKAAKHARTRVSAAHSAFLAYEPANEWQVPEMVGEAVVQSGEPAAHWLPRKGPDLRSPTIFAAVASGDEDQGAERERAIRRDSAALRTVVNILEKWSLGAEQKSGLLGVPKRTFYQWCKYAQDSQLREPVGRDVLDRMSYILGIWKAAAILLPSEQAAIAFIKTPNRAETFRNLSPLERMLGGSVTDLAAVRQWFDGWRGG